MNCYFLKIILKNKVTRLVALGFIFICLVVSLQYKKSVREYGVNDYYLKYKSELIDAKASYFVNKWATVQFGDDSAFNDTVEGQTAMLQYYRWSIDELKKLVAMLEESDEVTEDFLNEERRYRVVDSLCYIQMWISVPNGDIPLEEALADDFEKHKDFLKLDELPFSFVDLAYCGQGMYDAELTEAHDNLVLEAKLVLDGIDNDALVYEKPSPYIFLERLLGEFELTTIVFPFLILIPSVAIIMKWKEENAYRLKINLNYSDSRMFNVYVSNTVAIITGMIVLIIGAFFVVWGIRGGFSGIRSLVMCDGDNFSRFSNFTHFDVYEEYYELGISKVFFDLYNSNIECTLHSYTIMELWEFFLRAGLLSLEKIIFYVVLGAGIGFLSNGKIKAIVATIICSIMIVAGANKLQVKPWNPFTIRSCWNITLGGFGITWLNAVLLLAASIVILYALFMITIRLKDTE